MDTLTIIFSEKTYIFDETIILNQFRGYVRLKGSGLTNFKLTTTLIQCIALSIPLQLVKDIYRNDKSILVDSGSNDVSLVRIMSTDIVESAWNSKANDLVRVDTIIGNKIFFKDSINFGYDVDQAELLGYVDSWIALEGINFTTSADIISMISLTGMSVDITNCTFNNDGMFNMHALVDMYNVENVRVHKVKISGTVDYGFLINGSRNVLFTAIQSYTCLEPIVPATWTTNLSVDSLYCKGSVIDAHPSFYISYKDVTIEDGAFYWNCRALGVRLENCSFDVMDSYMDSSLYLGVLALTEKYLYLYKEYDVLCTNVTWVHKDLNFNGLHVHACRRFIVDGCETHEVSVGPDVKEFVVKNSHVGRVSSANSTYTVENTVFVASLQRLAIVNPPLSCSNEGLLNVVNCQFIGYEEQYLFNYIHWPTTKIYLQNCTFSTMEGFVKTTYMEKDKYTNIFISEDYNNERTLGMFNDVHINVGRRD